MKNNRKFAILLKSTILVMGTLLVGCQKYVENWEEVSEVPELKVHAVDYSHNVHFDPITNEPDNLEMTQLGQFLVRVRTKRDDKLEIRYSDSAPERKKAAILKAILEDQGYAINVKRLDKSDGETEKKSPVTLVVTKAVIKLPDCPNWTDKPRQRHNNLASANFGCANVTNLGLMVERPMDLVVGRGRQVFDGNLAASSIQRYRQRQTEPLKLQGADLLGKESTSGKSGSN